MKVPIQTSLEGHPDLADIPVLYDLATAEAERQILYLLLVDQKVGRSFIAPPELPADRKADLQNAFRAALLDADLNAEAERLKLDVAPVSDKASTACWPSSMAFLRTP